MTLTKMRKFSLITAALLVLCLMSSWAIAGPVAVIDEPVFTFKSVPEGTRIEHVFIIKNTGDTDLNIENVLPP